MKKTSFALLAMAIAIGACKKKEDAAPTAPEEVGAVPSSFSQEVLVEEMTGAWCGWCVLGAEGIKTAVTAHPGKVNAVACHGGSGEPMTKPEYSSIISFSGATGVPHYRCNRGTGGGFPGSFSTNVNTALAQTAQCGLAMDTRATSGSTISVTVHAGFKSALTGDYRLVVYLIENSITNSATNYDQHNYVYNNASYSTSEYYTKPSVIPGYSHLHVERKLLSVDIHGDAIPSANVVAGGEYVKTYTYAIPAGSGWNTSNMAVVAGILKYGATVSTQQFMNSQECGLGSVRNWE